MTNNDIVPGFDEERDEKLSIFLESCGGARDALCLLLSGYIDTYNAPVFERRMNLVLGRGYTRLVFDLASLNYMSSTGIYAFLTLLKACRARGGEVILVGMSENVFGVFELLGFSSFFPIRPSLKEAIEEFCREPILA
jgi:anti-anti-sigma factor